MIDGVRIQYLKRREWGSRNGIGRSWRVVDYFLFYFFGVSNQPIFGKLEISFNQEVFLVHKE